MKKIKLLTAIATATVPLSLIVTSCSQAKEVKVYRDINFNEGWTFRLNDDKQEQTINLPHDFSIVQKFKHSERELKHNQTSGTTGFLPGGVGYYHKDFVLPKKDNATVILNFDGAYNDTLVSVNGKIVGNNKYGYNPFAFDISNYVTADGQTSNSLDVIVRHEHITSSRWYPGSGIYRDVKISVVDKLHVAHNGTYVSTPYLKDEVGKDVTVNVDVDVQNSYDDARSVHVNNRIVDLNGDGVSAWVSTKAETIDKQSTATFNTKLKVNNPNLWSAETPNLYYVETQVVSGNTVVDQYKTRFGFRYYEFDKQGFKVNGNLIKLHGVCLHHDQGALGAAAYNDAIYRQLCIMKEMGVNAVRTSHNCPDQDFLRMCDELGLYVMDEAFDGWEFPKTSDDFSAMWKEKVGVGNNLIDATPDMQWHSFVMHNMVKRDRNCPSIFMWSLGNELHEGAWHDDIDPIEKDQIKAEMINFAYELRDIAESLDHDPTTRRWCGIALERDPNVGPEYDFPKCEIARRLWRSGGVMGLNYPSQDTIVNTQEWCDKVFGSETASANNSRGMYATYDDDENEQHFRVTSYDNAGRMMASEVLWQTLSNDGYGGQFVWTGFDYIGEPSPWCWNCEEDDWHVVDENWPYPNSAYYGIVDTCGFPKDSYYLYRSHLRQDDTTLHLVGSLNEMNMYTNGMAGSVLPIDFTPIDIYTNAPYVLIKDGETSIAEVTRTPVKTSQGLGQYYTYEAAAIAKPEVCVVRELEAKRVQRHGMYSSIWVRPEKINSNITAEAYDKKGGNLISQTVGLKQLKRIDRENDFAIDCKAERETIPADGKSLSYVVVDLKDANGTLITDWDSQADLQISWSGAGQVLGVDNGHPADHRKFQNPEIFHKAEQTAEIRTFAGKALIIVCAGNEPGDIEVKIGNGTLGYKTVTIKTE